MRFFVFAILAFASLAGCKPKAGAKCTVGQALCEDTSAVLACQGGVFAESHCRGPNGCSKLGNKVTCDDSIADEGDSCLTGETENHACSVDAKRHLLCESGKFKTIEMCRGPK